MTVNHRSHTRFVPSEVETRSRQGFWTSLEANGCLS